MGTGMPLSTTQPRMSLLSTTPHGAVTARLSPQFGTSSPRTSPPSMILSLPSFDATANEVPGLEIRGYPTLKFYPKDNKAGVDFAGDRQLADFQLYLLENSSAYQAFRPAQPGAGSEEL